MDTATEPKAKRTKGGKFFLGLLLGIALTSCVFVFFIIKNNDVADDTDINYTKAYITNTKIAINGQVVQFKDDQGNISYPYKINGEYYAPIWYHTEIAGYKVAYNEHTDALVFSAPLPTESEMKTPTLPNIQYDSPAATAIYTTTETPTTTILSYQSILSDYARKLRDASSGLVAEYKVEANKNTDGLEGLAQLCNDKIGKLAEISNDGIGEMASFMLHSKTSSYEEYEEWAGKLMDVYQEEAGKITDAYMKSAS